MNNIQDVLQRLEGFTEEWPKGLNRGDGIYGLHTGNEREQNLNNSDIIALCQFARTALTQAAEIERGDKVVVPREPTDAMLDAYNDVEPHSIEFSDEYFVYVSPFKQVKAYKAMITASEGKDDE